jgi:hypothetical protein
MKKGGIGGGKTITGLDFEKKVDFQYLLSEIDGYDIRQIQGKVGKGVFFDDLLDRARRITVGTRTRRNLSNPRPE